MWLIYKRTNAINGKSYIGLTSKSVEERGGKNGYKYVQKSQPIFAAAIKKYGWDAFTTEVLEANIETLAKADEREQFWISYYHTYIYDPQCNGYNATPGGNAQGQASVATRAKISAAKVNAHWYTDGQIDILVKANRPIPTGFVPGRSHKLSDSAKLQIANTIRSKHYKCYNNGSKCIYVGEGDAVPEGYSLGKYTDPETEKAWKQKLHDCNVGKTHTVSEATKQKIRLAGTGKVFYTNGCVSIRLSPNDPIPEGFYRGVMVSEAAKLAAKKNGEKKKRKVYCVELNRIFLSAKDASIELNINRTKICACCHHKIKTSGGYHWLFVDELPEEDLNKIILENAQKGQESVKGN